MTEADIVNSLTKLNFHLHILTDENKSLLKDYFILPFHTLFVMKDDKVLHIGNVDTLKSFICKEGGYFTVLENCLRSLIK